MLKIRLFRVGKKNQPSFKIVITDKRKPPRGGRFVEEVGSWNPLTKEKILKAERIKYWLSVGAKPSDSVYNLLVKEKICEGKKIPVHKKKKEVKKPAEAPTGAPAEKPAEEPKEVKAEGEVKAEKKEEVKKAQPEPKQPETEKKEESSPAPAETPAAGSAEPSPKQAEPAADKEEVKQEKTEGKTEEEQNA
jgi:small subunit ribosomal protein S16